MHIQLRGHLFLNCVYCYFIDFSRLFIDFEEWYLISL